MAAGDDIRYGRRGGGWLPKPKLDRCVKCEGPVHPDTRRCAWCGRLQLAVIDGDGDRRPAAGGAQLSFLDDGGAA